MHCRVIRFYTDMFGTNHFIDACHFIDKVPHARRRACKYARETARGNIKTQVATIINGEPHNRETYINGYAQ